MNTALWEKACPRCSGTLFIEDISGEWSIACLQCGYRKYIDYQKWNEAGLPEPPKPQPDKVKALL